MTLIKNLISLITVRFLGLRRHGFAAVEINTKSKNSLAVTFPAAREATVEEFAFLKEVAQDNNCTLLEEQDKRIENDQPIFYYFLDPKG